MLNSGFSFILRYAVLCFRHSPFKWADCLVCSDVVVRLTFTEAFLEHLSVNLLFACY